MTEIKFYETNKPYGCFSNFAPFPIEINGEIWPTSEHYFQGQKFNDPIHQKDIREAKKPMDAARMGRDRNRPLRKDWEEVKDEIMMAALIAKIEQHKAVKDILLSTGDCILIEHTSNDSYWADGGDGSGANMLGIMLMKIRNQLPEYTGKFFAPQWIKYPGIHQYDMFWRMGTGETYVMQLAEWFYGLSEESQKQYDEYFVPPSDWSMV